MMLTSVVQVLVASTTGANPDRGRASNNSAGRRARVLALRDTQVAMVLANKSLLATVKNLLATVVLRILPDMVDSKNLPDMVDSKNLPDMVDSKNLPDMVDSKNLPDMVETHTPPAVAATRAKSVKSTGHATCPVVSVKRNLPVMVSVRLKATGDAAMTKMSMARGSRSMVQVDMEVPEVDIKRKGMRGGTKP
jgi:hypothetical protein